MSDIKYIIAGRVEDDDGEQPACRCTRRPFPCLAVVRYALAGVVTVLAVALISMVFRAMLRSEDIRLFVNNGYIGADILWHSDSILSAASGNGVTNLGVSKVDAGSEYPQSTQILPRNSRQIGGCYLGCSGGSGSSTNLNKPPPSHPASKVMLEPPTETNLRIILVVSNPGGRTRIDCNRTTVRISDDRENRKQVIAVLELSNFTVQPQTTITLQKRAKITNETVLKYIWDNYGGQPTFGVTVRVNSRVASYPLGKMTEPKEQIYACRSVTLGLLQEETSVATNQEDCSPDS